MKNTLTRIAILALVLVTAFACVACGGTKESKEETSSFNWSAHPASLDDWTISDVHSYMEACGAFADGYYYLDMSANDLSAMSLAGGFLYMDTETASVMDYVMAFNLSDAASKAVYDESVPVMCISGAVNVDAFVGQFSFSYSEGISETHIALMDKIVTDLSAHFGVTPITK